jgi:formate dehydrogenase subunit beta
VTTTSQFPAPHGPAAALRELLVKLVEQDVVDAVVVPLPQPRTGQVTHALVTDMKLLDQAQPLAPVMPVNAARLVTKLASRDPEKRLAVVLRPCEEKALVELVKLRQASLERVFPVVVDCAGAVPATELARLTEAADKGQGVEAVSSRLWAAANEPGSAGDEVPQLRAGCAICPDFVPGATADVAVHLFGQEGTIGVALSDRLEGSQEKLGLPAGDEPSTRQERIAALREARLAQRADVLKQLAAMEQDVGVLLDVVDGCLRCGNCQRACPICFCRRCTFEMPSFEHQPEVYLRRAEKRGAARLPDDVALFHLTRLAHVALSCVSCGACEAVCPADIPLTGMFAHVGARVRRPFEYEPGRSVDEELPLATFEREELEPQ